MVCSRSFSVRLGWKGIPQWLGRGNPPRQVNGILIATFLTKMTSKLYSEVLGRDWPALAENIRCAHATGTEMNGVFRITYGMGWAAKQLARRSNLPQTAEAADTRLKIVAEDAGERWERQFDGKAFMTRQWKGKDGVLVERFGEWELRFKLRVQEGNLFYDQAGARLCLGALHIPMPLVCAPRVVAKETQDGAARVRVSVRVTLPVVGLLIAYEGYLNVKENLP
jgi:hypothetical protein